MKSALVCVIRFGSFSMMLRELVLPSALLAPLPLSAIHSVKGLTLVD